MKLTKNMKIGLAIIAIGVIAIATGHSLDLSILPSWEGLNTGVEGVTIDGSFYVLGSQLPTGYSWGSLDPASVILGADLDIFDTYGAVKAQCPQNPIIIQDPYTNGKTVDYWVKVNENKFYHVTGEIITYQMRVAISSIYGGPIYVNNGHIFRGEKWWFSLNSIVWDQALQEQSPVGDGGTGYGQAWETYLAAIIQPESSIVDLGAFYYLDPAPTSGRQFTLYSSPEMTGVISDLTQGNVNATFAGDTHPDSRMKQTAFFAIEMQEFGETATIYGNNNPTANYYIKVYALRLGKFTYTNPDSTPWADEQPPQDMIDQFLNWLNDLLGGQLGWLFGTIYGIPIWVIVLVVGLIVFIKVFK